MIAVISSLIILSTSHANNIPPNFAVEPNPNDAVPIISFSTTSTVDDLSCGGIAFCKTYKPDACNTCRCSFDSPAPAMCTKMLCTESYDMPQCIDCMDGYTMRDGACVKSAVTARLCTCPRIYNPVCCGGTTFNSPCEANCGGFSSCDEGMCKDTKPAAELVAVETLPQPIGFCTRNAHCVSYTDGCNSCRCTSDGKEACTMRMCLDAESPPAKCTQCEAGYLMDDAGFCTASQDLVNENVKRLTSPQASRLIELVQ